MQHGYEFIKKCMLDFHTKKGFFSNGLTRLNRLIFSHLNTTYYIEHHFVYWRRVYT